MPTIDQYLNPVDVKDSHVLTRTVNREVDEGTLYNIPFAPLMPKMSRKVKLRVKHMDGAGLAAFKADNASTPIVSGSGGLIEQFFDLLVIEEKDILKESDLIALASPDPLVAKTAANDVLDKAVRLRKRNINRTKWLAWMAVQDNLTVTYPDGATIGLDYDLAGSYQNSYFTSTHKPTASVAWSNVAADVMNDVYTWAKLISDDSGVDPSQCVMYISSLVWRYLWKNTGVKAELSGTQPRRITPTLSEVTDILGIGAIRIYTEFYSNAAATTKTKYLGDGNVLISGPDVIDGSPIIDMVDGPMVRFVGGEPVVEPNPGAIAELYAHVESKTWNIRVGSARVPVFNWPQAVIWADISP